MKGITKKEFNEFINIMWKRLKEGEKKYGTKFETANIAREMLFEATDLANYSLMLYLQSKKFQEKIKNKNDNRSTTNSK
jgi:hypothetical protein